MMRYLTRVLLGIVVCSFVGFVRANDADPDPVFLPIILVSAPTPTPIPPSFNNCQADPYADRAPNVPVRIVTVLKRATPEAVRLENVSPAAIDLTGWTLCSIRGTQVHEGISGVLAAGETKEFPSIGSELIWNNSEDDDGALYDAAGYLISYWDDQ